MLPNQILRKARRDNEFSLAQMGELLNVSGQRVSQWEGGDPIPDAQAFAWAVDEELPDWVRAMGRTIALAQIKADHQTLGEKIAALQRVMIES